MIKLGVAVLAAGKGTRLKLEIPKALCPLLGGTMIDFVLNEIEKFSSKNKIQTNIGVVVGHFREQVESHLKNRPVSFAVQKEQLGTADALKSYFESTDKSWDTDYTLICCADTPCLTADIFEEMIAVLNSNKKSVGVCASFKTPSPKGYGRIVRGDIGFKIVEEKDASDAERKIDEVNSGLYIFKTNHIKENLFSIDDNNKSGEFYLTDLVGTSFNVTAHCFENGESFQGVNNLIQLENAQHDIQRKIIEKHQLNGVRFINSNTCYIEPDVAIASGTVIYPGVVIEGKSSIGENSTIESNVIIKNSKIGSNVSVLAACYLEEATVGSSISIGPMARLRPGTILEDKVKIGNFVEIKNSTMKEGSKASHLSYIGDAEIGKNSNLGCGFITCNYDGAQKHKTIIGENTFVGSDCQMVAPITLGDNVYIGSGSTLTKDVGDGDFAIARSRQVTKEGMAKRFLK